MPFPQRIRNMAPRLPLPAETEETQHPVLIVAPAADTALTNVSTTSFAMCDAGKILSPRSTTVPSPLSLKNLTVSAVLKL